eukprot:COSAG02_NODE_20525_length_827_cov_1.126374_1_plen_217_part_10
MQPEPELVEGVPPSIEIPIANVCASRCYEPPPPGQVLPFPAALDFATMRESHGSPLWDYLHKRVALSLPGSEILELRRFGCRNLWERFQMRKFLIARENNGNANTQLMFHGTADPTKITGTGFGENGNGFDPRHSNLRGAYGAGAYFAEHAFYPVCIYPREQNLPGVFHIFVAEVIVGQEKDYGDSCARGLRLPPERTPGHIFDSVSGTEGRIGTRR